MDTKAALSAHGQHGKISHVPQSASYKLFKASSQQEQQQSIRKHSIVLDMCKSFWFFLLSSLFRSSASTIRCSSFAASRLLHALAARIFLSMERWRSSFFLRMSRRLVFSQANAAYLVFLCLYVRSNSRGESMKAVCLAIELSTDFKDSCSWK